MVPVGHMPVFRLLRWRFWGFSPLRACQISPYGMVYGYVNPFNISRSVKFEVSGLSADTIRRLKWNLVPKSTIAQLSLMRHQTF